MVIEQIYHNEHTGECGRGTDANVLRQVHPMMMLHVAPVARRLGASAGQDQC